LGDFLAKGKDVEDLGFTAEDLIASYLQKIKEKSEM
jgi:hypothetical protein